MVHCMHLRCNFLLLGLLVFISPTLLPAQQVDFQSLLQEVDRKASFIDADFAAEYTMVHDIPGRGRERTVTAIFRRDAQQQYVIIILEPESRKGQGYLKQGPTLWFYDPVSRRFNSTRSGNRFQNSNARNSDFTESTLSQDYRVVSGSRVTLGRFDCWKLNLEAVSDGVTYQRISVWIDDHNLIRKTEDYSLSGQLLRTTAIPEYQFIGGRAVPQAMLIVDALEGAMIDSKFVNERTQITISKVSFEKLPNSVFNRTFLENVGQ